MYTCCTHFVGPFRKIGIPQFTGFVHTPGFVRWGLLGNRGAAKIEHLHHRHPSGQLHAGLTRPAEPDGLFLLSRRPRRFQASPPSSPASRHRDLLPNSPPRTLKSPDRKLERPPGLGAPRPVKSPPSTHPPQPVHHLPALRLVGLACAMHHDGLRRRRPRRNGLPGAGPSRRQAEA